MAEQVETEVQTGIQRNGNEILFNIDPEVTHRFLSEGQVDLTTTQSDGEYKAESITTSDLLQVAVPAQEGLKPDQVKSYLRYVSNPEVRRYLERIRQTGDIPPVTSDELNQQYVYHAGASIFVDNNGTVINKVTATKEKGKYGGEGRVSYFGRNPEDALAHGLGNYNSVTNRGTEHPDARILMLKIDVKKLKEKRNIFIDPESLLPSFEEEFGNNFIVHNGIPTSAIESIEIMKHEGFEEN